MKTEINLNFRVLCQCVFLSLAICGSLFGGLFLWHLALQAIFSSAIVFFSLFGLSLGLGVLLLYDGEAFQWDHNPRIAIKRIREAFDDDE